MGEIFNKTMLQQAYQLACCSFFLLISSNSFSQPISNKAFWVCGDSRILLVDYEASINDKPAIIWQWDAKIAAGIPNDIKTKLYTVDDSKTFGSEVLLSSSAGAGYKA